MLPQNWGLGCPGAGVGEEGQDEVSPAVAEMRPGQSLWKTKRKQLRELRTKLLDSGVGPAIRSTV